VRPIKKKAGEQECRCADVERQSLGARGDFHRGACNRALRREVAGEPGFKHRFYTIDRGLAGDVGRSVFRHGAAMRSDKLSVFLQFDKVATNCHLRHGQLGRDAPDRHRASFGQRIEDPFVADLREHLGPLPRRLRFRHLTANLPSPGRKPRA
jgi:hypothetical protein